MDFHCCKRAFFSFQEWGYSLAVVHRLLTAVVSRTVEQRFQACGLQWSRLMGSRVLAQ